MTIQRSTALLSIFGLALLAAACGGSHNRVVNGRVPNNIKQNPDQGTYWEAIGIGSADPTLATDTQRKATARDAAIVKAQFEMLSFIKGVEVSGGITVQRSMETDSTLETRLKDVIAGAEIVSTEFTNDNGCVVTIHLPKGRVEKLMGVKFK